MGDRSVIVASFFIQDLNRKKDIGANCLSVKFGAFHFVIDAGMDPKTLGNEALPCFSALSPNSVDFILVTHCHLDHLGALPILAKQQPQAQVLVSLPTSLLAPLMLKNSASVMTRQKEEKDVPEYPLFGKEDIAALQKKFFVLKTGKTYCLEKDGQTAKVTIYASGHVLGAAGVLIEHEGRRLFMTGDILFSDQNSLRGAQIPQFGNPDVLLLETTRGDTERTALRRDEETRLLGIIRKTIKRGGICLIPAFALGRIQELLVLFYQAKKAHKLPDCPIYCSGLGMSLVSAFDKMGRKLPDVHFSRQILKQLNVKQLRKRAIDPKTTKLNVPAIYLLSSGMLAEHTPAYNIAACLLKDNKNTVCFVGYCDEDTPGGRLQRVEPNGNFKFEDLNYTTPVRAKIERFDLSGHADRDDLYQFVLAQQPKKVVLTHGDANARQWFFEKFSAHKSDFSVVDPDIGKTYEL